MPNLYMTIGLPGSGKSTWAKDNLNVRFTEIFSPDEYRKKITGDANNQKMNRTVFNTLYSHMIKALNANRDVCIDATNINIKDRSHVFNIVKECSVKVTVYGVLFLTPDAECRRRNEDRDRVVPDEVITKMMCKFQIPLLTEGFKSIEIVYPDVCENETFSSMYKAMIGFDEPSPHHILPLNEHCKLCSKLLAQITNNPTLIFSGMMHDVGKIELYERNGNARGHANYGAYKILCGFNDMTEGDIDVVYLAMIVNFHMELFDKNFNKEKWFNRLGAKMMNELELFHDCDMESC